jgi:hypothetical protein
MDDFLLIYIYTTIFIVGQKEDTNEKRSH